jgi:HAE1 family hydrophobic/amphiphilic exporter-1
VEELESVSIQVQPPKDQTIDEVMAWLNENVVAPARAQGMIDRTMRVRMEGTAAKLDEVRASMFGSSGGREAIELPPALRRGFEVLSAGLVILGVVVGVATLVRARVRGVRGGGYALSGAVLATVALAGLVLAVGEAPQLIMARMVWALLVTYLLMAALFEKWVEPLVIMFSVPLAVVGGFAGLRLVHDWTLRNPTIAPQNLDVITMLGFVILIGTVVNNAILLVHQAMNFMKGEDDGGLKIEPMEPHRAIAESVRTRVRPIAMTVCTTVGGMAPLVLFPGAGSEMYRGLGSVVLGGLIVSTVFTLVLVPLLFSLVQDMRSAFGAIWAGRAPARAVAPASAA